MYDLYIRSNSVFPVIFSGKANISYFPISCSAQQEEEVVCSQSCLTSLHRKRHKLTMPKPTKKGKKGKKGKKNPVKELTGDAAENAKKELITSLMAKCDLNEEDVTAAYDDFHEKYPNGEISQEQFVAQSQAGILAESLFRVFDEDKSGELSFYEFLQANSVKKLNTPEDKLNWIFTAFDTDGGGSIDVDEIRDIVIGLFRLAGIDEDDDLISACVSDVRDAVDGDGDGDISKEEFVKNAMKSKFIFNMLKE